MTQIRTKRCSDGRACDWAGSSAFIPDDQEVCDACLEQGLNLREPSVSGCNCCEVEDAFTKDSVVAVLKRFDQADVRSLLPRFYVKTEVQHLDATGKPTNDVLRSRGHLYRSVIFDSHAPSPREPFEESGWKPSNKFTAARDRGERRVKELNAS